MVKFDKKQRDKARSKLAKGIGFPFLSKDYLLFLVASAVIFLGYVVLGVKPADSFWSLTLAPILLVLGYCVIIPLLIILKGREEKGKK